MRLEGTLDAFSLPDIFQLLSFTKKTGTLHLRRADCHGVVHLRDGAVTGARSDVARQALGRRVVGAGLVDDDSLEQAAAAVASDPTTGLARALLELGAVDQDTLRELAAEQATDSVFDLLRWPEGEFAFVVDEADPDDLGAALSVEDIVTEGRRRIETWPELTSAVPAPDSVVSVVAAPADEPAVTREEWALMALVDGHRTVTDLVTVTGKGEYAVVSALAGLVARGLLSLDGGDDAVARRQAVLAQLEGQPAPAPVKKTAAPVAPPRASTERKPVIPERPEPFTPPRQVEHVEEVPSYTRSATASVATPAAPPAAASVAASSSQSSPLTVTQTVGATALAPETAPSSMIERDPSVNKSLLLRLIAGVRGL